MQIHSHEDLEAFKKSFQAANDIYVMSKSFPKEETYSLTDQIRRSSRSVCANLAEAWRKRRYPAAFLAKLNDSEGEAAETQVWLRFAVECGYLTADATETTYGHLDEALRLIVSMTRNPHLWTINPR